MISKASILILFVLLNVNEIYLQEESNEYIKITSDIDLVVWDLEDKCSENAKSYRYLLSGKPNGLKNMIDFELELGQYLRECSNRLLKLSDTIPYDLERNFTRLTKSGDYLLAEEDWKMLNTFAYKNEDLQVNQFAILNDTELHKSAYEELLQSSKDIDELETAWSVWQEHISKYKSDFPEVLKLVNKAAKQNDAYNAKSYWEKMSDYEDLYSKNALWEEIEPLYRKLQKFVRRRLNHYYGTNYTDFIPAHLLGSNQGDDWTNIADIILPHPQLLYDINHNLLQKDIFEVYKIAENTTITLNLGKLGRHFWKQSDFNRKDCENHVLTYCNQKMSHLLTCPNTSYPHLLAAHTAALQVTVDRLDYSAYTHLLRPTATAVTEAVLALGDVFALADLERHGLLDLGAFSVGDDEASAEMARVNKMNAMLLLALRVFPRLAYTYAVDSWRLEQLEDDKNGYVEKNYWDIMKKFSGIEGVTNEEPTYLNDIYNLRNKPYINKFIGTILQFQILNHYQMDIFDDSTDIVKTIGDDSSTFLSMLQERSSRNVPDLVSYHYSIDDISAYPLTEFFSPLFEYLETVPIEQGKVVPKVRTTSTTTTTTTTTTSTTTKKPAVKEQDQNVLLKDAPSVPEKAGAPVKITKAAEVLSETSGANIKAAGSDKSSPDTGMIAIIVVIVTLSVCMVAALLWKKYKKKPHTNNRRFET